MEEEAICLQCGDRGFTNAFVYCVKCLNVAVHRYCLDVIPASVNEFVRWICEACEMKVRNLTAVCEHDAVRCHIRDHGASKHLIGNPGVNTEEPAYAADERKKCEESALQQLGEEKSKDNRMQHENVMMNAYVQAQAKKLAAEKKKQRAEKRRGITPTSSEPPTPTPVSKTVPEVPRDPSVQPVVHCLMDEDVTFDTPDLLVCKRTKPSNANQTFSAGISVLQGTDLS